MLFWTSTPEVAWWQYVLPGAANPRWINDGSEVSDTITLKKRELFALIIVAQLFSKDDDRWLVGYDPDQEQPNDGLIIKNDSRIMFEHKIIVEEAKQEVLREILETYRRYSAAVKGKNYGENRTLIIHPNKRSDHGGMIKISELARKIGKECSFDRVMTLGKVASTGDKNRVGVMHVVQHYPRVSPSVGQVNFDFPTGAAVLVHCPFEL